jgi:hypothetical protein
VPEEPREARREADSDPRFTEPADELAPAASARGDHFHTRSATRRKFSPRIPRTAASP